MNAEAPRRRARFLAGVAVSLVVSLVVGCPGTRRARPLTMPADAEMGLYLATLEREGAETRRFRLLLWAELPDRIHGEVLSAVGTTELILDGGAGRLAVTVPRERTSWVGAASADDLRKLLGVPLALPELVGGLLEGRAPTGNYRLDRRPSDRPGLPEQLALRGKTGALTLKLKRRQPLAVATATLGNGEAPSGMVLRPLADLASADLPDAAGVERR